MKSTWIAGLSAILFAALPVAAQPVIGAKSGIVNYVEGRVFLADKPVDLQAAQFPEVKENVVMRSDEGRAEVLLTPGTVLRLGEMTSFKMITNRLVDTRLELLTGSVTVVAMEVAKDAAVTLVYKDSAVTFTKAGVYRVDADPGVLKVFKGGADVKTASGATSVAAGKMLTLAGTVAAAEKFNPELTDSLDRWTRRRDELMAISNVSAANQVRKTGRTGGGGQGNCDPSYRNNPAVIMNLGSWGYNPYYGLGTYIPCRGMVNSPYGYRYWSPLSAYQAYFAPRPVYQPPSGGMGAPSYNTVSPSAGNYSGVGASSPAGSSAPAAAVAPSSGSSTAAAAPSSSVGGGAATSGGGRGH